MLQAGGPPRSARGSRAPDRGFGLRGPVAGHARQPRPTARAWMKLLAHLVKNPRKVHRRRSAGSLVFTGGSKSEVGSPSPPGPSPARGEGKEGTFLVSV